MPRWKFWKRQDALDQYLAYFDLSSATGAEHIKALRTVCASIGVGKGDPLKMLYDYVKAKESISAVASDQKTVNDSLGKDTGAKEHRPAAAVFFAAAAQLKKKQLDDLAKRKTVVAGKPPEKK